MSSSPAPNGEPAAASRLGRRYATLVVAAISFVALTCVAFLVPVPYVTMRPGPAFDTLGEISGEPMFTFGEGVQTYPTSGTLDFTTVSVTRSGTPLSLGEAVRAWLTDDVAVVPREFVYPDEETAQDSRDEGQAQLSGSKDASQVAALRAAGYTVGEDPRVVDVPDDGPSAGLLEPGDLVRAVDGRSTASSDAVVEAIGRAEPGEVVTVTVERDGRRRDVDVTTRAAEEDPDLPRVGIVLGTRWDFPVDIENNVGEQVGGPSAGAMFALAIYDRLTPGSLTGGRAVAGTGEIGPDGRIGPIGGIRQKMAGAAADGAEIFLVPAANCAEAVDGDDHGLRLVRTTRLEDAIESLEALADDEDARVPTCR